MSGNRRRMWIAKGALASALSAGLVVPEPALAQRRRGEPEANPEFQQQQLSAPGAGGPVDDSPAPDEAPARPPRSVQGVQIGAAPTATRTSGPTVAPLDTRVSVRVKNVPISTFLDTISAQAKVNFIITEGLETKKVTAFLQNVTVREALQVLLEIKGLTYQQIGRSNTYVVTQRSKQLENLITRIYPLNYIPLIKLDYDDKLQQAAQQQANAPMGVQPGQAPRPGAAPGEIDPRAANKGGQSLGAAPIDQVVASVCSRSGRVVSDLRTNSLIVTDVPEVFPQVEQIIAELDRKAPQVMIETQIVEIDSDRARELGFDWGTQNGTLMGFQGGARTTSFPLNLPKDLSRARFFDPLTGAAVNAAIPAATLTNGTFDLSSLQISLRALITRSEARFLGKPKILTLNNKVARIEISEKSAVGFRNTQTAIGGGGNQIQEAERIDTGLVLEVTPQVNKEGYITMLLSPEFTDVKPSKLPNVFEPVKRAAKTLVRVKNGQTLVLGGLLRSKEIKSTRKVPFLGYIPIVGWLFTSNSTSRTNADLVIFITPTVVSD